MPFLPNPVYGFPISGEMTVTQQARKDLSLGPQFSIHNALGGGLMPVPVSYAQSNGGAGNADTMYQGPFANYSALGQPAAVWIGAVALLGVLAYFSTRDNTLGGANPAHVRVGGYNFLTVGLISAVFFILLKAVFNRFPVPGFTEFANAL